MNASTPVPGTERLRTAVTHRREQWRAAASGILETAGTTFLLFIAVRGLNAGPTAKAMVAAGTSVGYLASPFVVSVVAARRWPAAQAASWIMALGAAAFAVMSLAPVLPVYVLGSVVGMASFTAFVPLMTQVYQENYPAQSRGHLFSRTVIIRIGAAALFSEAAGRILSRHFDQFRLLLLFFAGTCAFASACLRGIPSRALSQTGGTHPLRSLRFVRQDPLFRRTLVCWMFMGFANLMMLPLRVEFLANPKYGLALTAAEVAFLTGVLPNMARLVMSPVWGWLFDRVNFFLLRMVLNAGFAIGIFAFFTTGDLTGLILGALVFGVSTAGGDVAWSLWVTKFAPPEQVADYMSVHTFLTGLRGVLAPWVAFQMAGRYSLHAMGWFSAALIVAATLLLLPELKIGRFGRKAEPWPDEPAE